MNTQNQCDNMRELCRAGFIGVQTQSETNPVSLENLKKTQKSDSKIFQANKASEKEPESMTEYCTIPYPFSCGGARSQPLLG
jgi:hypothetical protein